MSLDPTPARATESGTAAWSTSISWIPPAPGLHVVCGSGRKLSSKRLYVGAEDRAGDVRNEGLGYCQPKTELVECPVEHLAGDVLGCVPGPALGRVEGDHAERVRILPAQKIADDGFAIAKPVL
jgi:hypothetical protein